MLVYLPSQKTKWNLSNPDQTLTWAILLGFTLAHFFSYRTESFLPKQSQKSRSTLWDRSRSLGLFRKDETCITATFQRTDFVIFYHSREGKTQSYSRVNMVIFLAEKIVGNKRHCS